MWNCLFDDSALMRNLNMWLVNNDLMQVFFFMQVDSHKRSKLVWNMLSNALNAIGILEKVEPSNNIINFPDQKPNSFLIITTIFFRH